MKRGFWILGLAGALASCTDPPVTQIAWEQYQEANTLFERDQFADAVPLYEYTVRHRDRIVQAHQRLAFCYEALGRETDAIYRWEQALKVDPSNPVTTENLTRLYLHTNQLDRARDLLEKRLALDVDNAALRDELDRVKMTLRERAATEKKP